MCADEIRYFFFIQVDYDAGPRVRQGRPGVPPELLQPPGMQVKENKRETGVKLF